MDESDCQASLKPPDRQDYASTALWLEAWEEYHEAREGSEPVSDAVLLERMRTEATKAVRAISHQGRRLSEEYDDPWLMEADLRFLVVALRWLDRCIASARRRVPSVAQELDGATTRFLQAVPFVRKIRNVIEHVDEYNVSQGREPISRRQVQVWRLEFNETGGPIWHWLGHEIDVQFVVREAVMLYDAFCDAAGAFIQAWDPTERM